MSDSAQQMLDALRRKRDEHERLQNAAPKLLSALRGMCSVWLTVCNSKGWDPEHVTQYAKALAAINDATGEKE